jgi:glycosyltransferase involved in cell wall biosynthesis
LSDGNRLIVHLPTASLPWVTGGREVYSFTLAKELTRLGWRNALVFHQNEAHQEPVGFHQHQGVDIHILPPISAFQRAEVYACRTATAPGFQELLQQLQPGVVHLHDFSVSVNLLHLDLAKRAGAKTVMTYHSPGQSCLERELLHNGTTVCDGEIIRDRCTACRLGVQGIPSFIRWPLAKLSLSLAKGQSSLQRALSARHMTDLFADAWRSMVDQIDCIHIYADWVKALMRRNGVPEEKLAFFRTGLPFSPNSPSMPPVRKEERSDLHLVMLGRCDRIKGQEVLIDAVQALAESFKVNVSFFGPYWDQTDYGRKCLKKIAGDPRFQAPELVPHAEIPQRLAQADVLVVPSLWLETGPLVVLEGFAAGLPIVGSRLGGIAELVRHDETGLLFEPGDARDLQGCLERLLCEPQLLQNLAGQIQQPRTMRDVAVDTAKLYDRLLTP